MAGIQFDTKKLKGGLAALLGGIVLASAIQGAEPPEHVLESTRVRGAAARAMVNLDRRMICWKGETPRFDGRIGEWRIRGCLAVPLECRLDRGHEAGNRLSSGSRFRGLDQARQG